MIISTYRKPNTPDQEINDPVILKPEDLTYIQNHILTKDTGEISEIRAKMSNLAAKIKGFKNEDFDAELGRIRLIGNQKYPFYPSRVIPGFKIPLKQDPKRGSEWIADFSKVYAERKEVQKQLKVLREEILPELRISQGIRNLFILENIDTNLLYVVSSVYYEYAEEVFSQFLNKSYNKEVDEIKGSCRWNIFYVGALSEKVEKGPVFQRILEYLNTNKYETYNIQYKELVNG